MSPNTAVPTLSDPELAAVLARTAGDRLLALRERLGDVPPAELKERGDVSMILIAHNYVHVFEVCDRVNLLRNGRITFDKKISETSVEEVTDIVATEYRTTATG